VSGAYRRRRAKHKGITYFLVDMKSPGHRYPAAARDHRRQPVQRGVFDDVFVPDEMVVGQVNDGWRLARTTLANERVAMAHGTGARQPDGKRCCAP